MAPIDELQAGATGGGLGKPPVVTLAHGTYIGTGLATDGNEVTYTVVLQDKRRCWLDYKAVKPDATESWHSEGFFAIEPILVDAAEVDARGNLAIAPEALLRYTIGGLPGQGRTGEVYEFQVLPGTTPGMKVLVCDGILCNPQADTTEGKKLCAKCGFAIIGHSLNYQGSAYHKECFTCDTCKMSLTGPFSTQADGRRLCQECIPKKYCEACKRVISGGKATQVSGAMYHVECFVCSTCQRPLQGSVSKKGDRFLCQECFATSAENKAKPSRQAQQPLPPSQIEEAAQAATRQADNEAPVTSAASTASSAFATSSAAEPTAPTAANSSADLVATMPSAVASSASEPAAPAASLDRFLTLKELQDPTIWKARQIYADKREAYLSDQEFTSIFGMSKDDFYNMPKWRRDNLKKKHNLF